MFVFVCFYAMFFSGNLRGTSLCINKQPGSLTNLTWNKSAFKLLDLCLSLVCIIYKIIHSVL